jgi:hypothetical protein
MNSDALFGSTVLVGALVDRQAGGELTESK